MAAKKQAKQTEKPAAKSGAKITVTALAALHEDGTTYQKGERFETTPTRAKALGELVTVADAKPETETK